MSYKLIIFPSPIDSHCELHHDAGLNVIGAADIHPTGRPGQSFLVPDSVPNGFGARLIISHKDKVTLNQKGILWLNNTQIDYPWTPEQTAAFAADDFTLADPVIVEVPVPPVNVPSSAPYDIIKAVFNAGNYDLSTKEGCGIFIEAACSALHNIDSVAWGHVRKTASQNQYNGHGVDTVMLKTATEDTISGIYDIIVNSESEDAKIAFNRVDDAHLNLWYYPA